MIRRVMILTLAAALSTVAGRSNHTSERLVEFDVADDLSSARLTFSQKGEVTVPLAFDPEITEKQELEVSDGRIEYFSPALYGAIEATTPGAIIFTSNVPHVPTLSAPPAEAETAGTGWPHPPGDIHTLFRIFAKFADFGGAVLCDETLPGATLYDVLRDDGCFVWCTGYSRMTLDMLRGQGTRARIVQLDGLARQLPSATLVLSSEGHTTVERWDGDHWAWLDPTFRIGAARLDGRTLSLAAFILAMADIAARDDLVLTMHATRGWEDVPFPDLDPSLQRDLLRFYTADKSLIVVP